MQVLEMVDDLLGDTLDPDLWNYGEAIRNAATGKTAEEQFLEVRGGIWVGSMSILSCVVIVICKGVVVVEGTHG